MAGHQMTFLAHIYEVLSLNFLVVGLLCFYVHFFLVRSVLSGVLSSVQKPVEVDFLF